MFDKETTVLTSEQLAQCEKEHVDVPSLLEKWALFPDETFEALFGGILDSRKHAEAGVSDAPVPETDSKLTGEVTAAE